MDRGEYHSLIHGWKKAAQPSSNNIMGAKTRPTSMRFNQPSLVIWKKKPLLQPFFHHTTCFKNDFMDS